MNGEQHSSTWRVVGSSVQGAAHIRSGKPNQDAIAWLPASGSGNHLVLALADGHGGARYIRSAEGARLAVTVATRLVWELFDSRNELANLSALKRAAEERLPPALVRGWQQAVQEHVAQMPFSEEEQHALTQSHGVAALAAIEANPPIAYGATLLVAVVMPACIIYLQLGDGDILNVSQAGEVTRPAIPGDERLFADETTSLCSPDAWRDVRVYFQALAGEPPALILLATDGYGKSFRNEAGFLAVGSDVLEMIRSDGLEAVAHNLPSWLSEASQTGSGDDITLGLLYRLESRDSSEQ